MNMSIDPNVKRAVVAKHNDNCTPQSSRLRMAIQASSQLHNSTYVSNRNVKPGQVDSVTWKLVNTGEVPWIDCVLSPEDMDTEIEDLGFIHPNKDIQLKSTVNPGESCLARLAYMAPMHKASVEREYRCKSLITGQLFGPVVSLSIRCDPNSSYNSDSKNTDKEIKFKRFDVWNAADEDELEEEEEREETPVASAAAVAAAIAAATAAAACPQVSTGSRIYVNWNTHHGPTWFPGTVTGIQVAAATVDILYDDGDERYAVPAARIRINIPVNGRSTHDHDRTFLPSDVHAVGDHVYTRFSRSWFPGVIVAVHEGGTFTVRYDDSEIQRRVRFNEIVSHPSLYTGGAMAPDSHAIVATTTTTEAATSTDSRWSRTAASVIEQLGNDDTDNDAT